MPPTNTPAPRASKRVKETPKPTNTPKPTIPSGIQLNADPGIRVSATYGLDSGIQFQRIDAGGVGIQGVIDAGMIDAIDVWGYVEQGAEVCFAAHGSVLFLDAATSPRRVSPIPAYRNAAGWTCINLNRPGTVVLVQAPASTVPPPLANCRVTTTYLLNLRETPGGNIITVLGDGLTLPALKRASGWFQVDFFGTLGWISSDYVTIDGYCG